MSDTLINTSYEYNVAKLKAIKKILEARMKCFYYKYEPAGTKHLKFHKSLEHIKGLQGANRAAKTTTMMQEIIWICLNEHPFIKVSGEQHWWWVGSTFKKMLEASTGTFQKFKNHLPMDRVAKHNLKKRSDNDYNIIFDNGSSIHFKSQEEGVRGFRESSIDGAVVDERMDNEEMRGQLRMRILDTRGRLYFTIDALEDDEWILDLKEKGIGYFDKVDTIDNKFIDKEAINELDYELDDVTADRLLRGIANEKGVSYIFPKTGWSDRIYKEIEPGRYTLGPANNFIETADGLLRIYKPYDKSKRYIMGIDGAEGGGGDDSAVVIFDSDGEQYAEFNYNKMNAYKFSQFCIVLGQHFGYALAVIENKSIGYFIIEKFIAANYPSIYFATKMEFNKVKSIGDYGIKTSTNKGVMIEKLVTAYAQGDLTIHSAVLKEQMQNYCSFSKPGSPTIKYSARLQRQKDDLVMALVMMNTASGDVRWFPKKVDNAAHYNFMGIDCEDDNVIINPNRFRSWRNL